MCPTNRYVAWKIAFSRFFASAGFVASVAIVAAGRTDAQAVRDALEVQKARGEKIAREGKQSTYDAAKFDLSGLPPYVPQRQVSGTIRIWGNSYIVAGTLGDYWTEGFHRFQPGATLDLSGLKNPLVALPGLVTGLADLAACRQFHFLDVMAFERVFNYDPLQITMATGSYDVPGWQTTMAVFVNKDNPLSALSVKQLDGIFGGPRDGAMVGTTWHPELSRSAADNIRTWGQAGLTGEWADKPINAYVVQILDNTMVQYLLFQGSPKWNENVHEYANYARPDGSFVIAWSQVVHDLAGDRYGIALSTVQYATPQIKLLAVAPREGGLAVPLSIESVQDRSYPLSMSTFLYLNRKPGTPLDPKVREFVMYVLSREGQQAVAREGRYLPLTAEIVAQERRKLD